jgi:hypothetical protein
VTFKTIYPGWYRGRAVHIHFKVRESGYEFTSQLFFDPQLTRRVMAQGVYAARGEPDTTNATDNIYGANGSRFIVPLTADGAGGYTGTFTVGLSGLPAARLATLSAARVRRTASGRRILRLSLRAHERVTVAARLTRARRRLGSVRGRHLAAGARHVDLRLGRDVTGGKASLTVVVKDASGATRTIHRTVQVPRRRAQTSQ